ncbi:hypothetical protein B0J14DRAFT_79950 [Halenospora varia]|nr:hypothetical protein B0J14DRAFT_79950 [Halenospora varia]
MSVCMRSARSAPMRGLASRKLPVTTTPPSPSPWTRNSGSGATKRRWNSTSRTSNASGGSTSTGATVGRTTPARKGWTTNSVLGLVAATGIFAGALATFQARRKTERERQYSSPRKFVQPAYATVQDLEAVSPSSTNYFPVIFLHSTDLHYLEMLPKHQVLLS